MPSTARLDAILGRDEVLGRIDVKFVQVPQGLAAGRIDDRQRLDLVAEKFKAQRDILRRRARSRRRRRARESGRAEMPCRCARTEYRPA